MLEDVLVWIGLTAAYIAAGKANSKTEKMPRRIFAILTGLGSGLGKIFWNVLTVFDVHYFIIQEEGWN